MDIENIVILTGAGISAESGLQTFRGSDGLWCGHRVKDVATPEGYAANPTLVQEFYNMRRRQLLEAVPNAAHHALARLAKEWRGNFLLVTQNVDDLHERGGSPAKSLLHMHGELKKKRHNDTGAILKCDEDLECDGDWRPHIVWFGEMPLEMERIYHALRKCDLFISIGTSGNVYPAAGFVAEAHAAGARTVELNLEPSMGTNLFAERRYGNATKIVPAYVAELLK